MHNWKGINEDSWAFKSSRIYGAGGGIGGYKTSYAFSSEGNAFLNGKISADIKITKAPLIGAGLVCRADEMWTFVAMYVFTATSEEGRFTAMRISIFKEGAFLPLYTSKERIDLDDNFNHFSLDFFSGRLSGEITTSEKTYSLEGLVPHIPFPGYAGLVRFYGSSIIAKDIQIEKINYPLIPVTSNNTEEDKKYHKYDVFISYSTKDRQTIENIVRDLDRKGISYWVDFKQIKYGDSITNKIEEGLRESKNVLVCLSVNLGRSNWSEKEYGTILSRELSSPSGKRVIPLRLDNCSDDDIPILLYNLRRAEYSNKKEYDDLLSFLKS